jgi:hypothetical protein
MRSLTLRPLCALSALFISSLHFALSDWGRGRRVLLKPLRLQMEVLEDRTCPSGLAFSTYLGGSSNDASRAIAVDAAGDTYVAGLTDSADFPVTAGAYETTYPGGTGGCGFVAKFNPGGSLVWATYLGGSAPGAYNSQQVQGIAVDSSGNVYVTGITDSSAFPTTPGAFQSTYGGGGYDAFVTKINSTGTALIYSTFLGGSGDDFGGLAIAVDASGNAYVTGGTRSSNFPTTAGALQTTFPGSETTGFVTKLNPSGSALAYSTYLGGSNGFEQSGFGIAVNAAGNAYVTGRTDATNFPTTTGSFQTSSGSGGGFEAENAFVTELNPAGSGLVYSTYLGGSSWAEGDGIVLDGSGNAYVAGYTSAPNFPTTSGAFQSALAGGDNTFVTKLNPSGTALVYSTYLGGSGDDLTGEGGTPIALDASGNAYVVGHTTSTNFPTANPVQATNGGGTDAFVTELNATGTGLRFSTYLGGSGDELGVGSPSIAVSAAGNILVTGSTSSTNFPTANPFQASNAGGDDSYVAEINPGLAVGPATLPAGTLNIPFNQTVTASGGTGAITFGVSAGSLPTGLSLNSSTGVISGTPTSANNFAFTIEATDSVGATGSQSYSIIVYQPLVLIASGVQVVVDGSSLSVQVTAQGGNGSSLTFSLGAEVPAGAGINAQGVFTWTPAEANGQAPGIYSINVSAVENNLPLINASLTLTITVGPSSTNQGSGMAARETAALGLTQSAEYYTDFIIGAYNKYLGRGPDTLGLAYWLNLMRNQGFSDEHLEAGFIGSTEYINDHGGAGSGWVTAMYVNLLGRTPQPSEVQYWLNQLAAGETTADIAFGFAASQEREAQHVQADYQQYLGRSASASEVTYWVNFFLSGGSNEQVIAGFISSQEYFQDHGNNIVDWLFANYRSTLNREPDNAGYQYWLSQLTAQSPTETSPFAGSYSGSYSGTGMANGISGPVSGGVAFTVDNSGAITVTDPGAATGSVADAGNAQFSGAGGIGSYAGADYVFTGTFVVANGSVSASGSWTATYTGGSASGSWSASQQ